MNLLLGPATLDTYVQEGRVLPGDGALNMAYHWSRLGVPFHFLGRVGDDHPEVFVQFLQRQVFDGRSAPTEHRVPVKADEVADTTVGCGDAFVAAFLARWWRGADVLDAAEAGTRAGAAATARLRPLPDDAYRTPDEVGSNDVTM